MKTILFTSALIVVAVIAGRAQPAPGSPCTAADLAYWQERQAKTAVQTPAVVYVPAPAPAASRQLDEVNAQLLQLRIETAYPNNPAMWRWLNRNPRYIDTYLGVR